MAAVLSYFSVGSGLRHDGQLPLVPSLLESFGKLWFASFAEIQSMHINSRVFHSTAMEKSGHCIGCNPVMQKLFLFKTIMTVA